GSDSSTQTSSPYSQTYSWTASASASGSKTVISTNGAGLTGTSAFTVTPDTTAPSGESVALVGGPYYTSLSVPLTLSNGSDAGSGLDTSSAIVERDSATLSGGTCGSFSGNWSTVSLVSGADTTVTSGHGYKYRY